MYDGHELPEDINAFTKRSATALAGQGLMGVARDNYPHDGELATRSSPASPKSRSTSKPASTDIVDYLAVADVGTVIHPAALGGQILGRSMLGIAHAIGQKWVYDQHYGVRARQAVPPEQAADDPRCADEHGVGGGRASGSGDAGRRARHRRAAGRRPAAARC